MGSWDGPETEGTSDETIPCPRCGHRGSNMCGTCAQQLDFHRICWGCGNSFTVEDLERANAIGEE